MTRLQHTRLTCAAFLRRLHTVLMDRPAAEMRREILAVAAELEVGEWGTCSVLDECFHATEEASGA